MAPRGSVLVFSLIVLSFLLMSAVSLSTISTITNKSSLSSKNSNIAFQSADSMVEIMLQKIYTMADTIPDLDDLVSKIGYSSTCTNGVIKGVTLDGTYVAVLADVEGTIIACNDSNWRDIVRVIELKSTHSTNDRSIRVNVTPSCNKVSSGGKAYNTASFGDACWMVEDLMVNGGNGGVDIPEENTVFPIPGGFTGEHYPATMHYSWTTAMNGSMTPGAQGICPRGWHIPTRADFDALVAFIQPKTDREWKLQSREWAVWNSINYNNDPLSYLPESLFNAIPSGITDTGNNTSNRGINAYFWTSNPGSMANSGWSRYWSTWYSSADDAGSEISNAGLSLMAVRCVKSLK